MAGLRNDAQWLPSLQPLAGDSAKKLVHVQGSLHHVLSHVGLTDHFNALTLCLDSQSIKGVWWSHMNGVSQAGIR